MSFTVIAVGVAFFYFTIWFMDSIFKSCMHYPYYAFLKGTGLKFGLLHFTWSTTAFNRFIFKWSKRGSKFFHQWFTIGAKFTVILFLPFSFYVLYQTAALYLGSNDVKKSESPVLSPVIPGVNLPASDFWSYLLALFVCSLLHELGHTVAAVQDDVQILSLSIFVTLVIPVTFVKLNSDHLLSVPLKKRLNIFCAGVWHNVTIALIALLLLKSTPFIFNVAYKSGSHVVIKQIEAKSPLLGTKGFEVGDAILEINKCKTTSYDKWMNCLFMNDQHFGLCVSNEIISNHDEIVKLRYNENDIVDCCNKNEKESICFEYIEPATGVPSLSQYSCLKPRKIIEDGFFKCLVKGNHHCDGELHCLKPLLSNSTFLFVIQRLEKNPVLYMGHPSDLFNTVKVTQYVPRNRLLSFFSPDDFEKALYYILTISLGLAFLNVIPCFGFDGHHIARCLIQMYASKFEKSSAFVEVTTLCIVLFGTLCTVPILIVMFYEAFCMF